MLTAPVVERVAEWDKWSTRALADKVAASLPVPPPAPAEVPGSPRVKCEGKFLRVDGRRF